ncbi:MAG: CDP-alcohol phosphatidyltransferase family protein [Candidatus Paceibacterota bacterium]|jgi:CDP-diacylglycerol--serine O-phosphatidyltransferase|nr:CDP-alcohol phosphatidyltransferase family protein [bacterium]
MKIDLKTFLRNNFANIISLATVPFALSAFYYIFLGNFFLSFLFINIAFFLDTLDGYFARRLKIESTMGKLLDSFCDVINYLIYPALFIYKFFTFDFLTVVVISSFIVIFGIVRLARFTNEGFVIKEGKNYYKGLPVPVVLYGTVICYVLYDKFIPNLMTYFFPAIMIILSLLMVSTVKVKKINNVYWYFLVLIGLLLLSL